MNKLFYSLFFLLALAGFQQSSAQSESLTITDTFGAKDPTEDNPTDAAHLVRLYCMDNDHNYYIADADLDVSYTDNNTITGIDGVTDNSDKNLSVAPTMATDAVTVSGCNGAVVIRSISVAVATSLPGNGETTRTVNVGGLAPGCYIVASGGQSQRI